MMRSRFRRAVVRTACGIAAVCVLLAGGSFLNLRTPVWSWMTVSLRQGTFRVEGGAGIPAWRGHPMEVRAFSRARGNWVLEVGAVPLAGAAVGLVGIALWARRERGYPKGSCQSCGYDLKGLPADAACPECGAPIKGGPSAAVRALSRLRVLLPARAGRMPRAGLGALHPRAA